MLRDGLYVVLSVVSECCMSLVFYSLLRLLLWYNLPPRYNWNIDESIDKNIPI